MSEPDRQTAAAEALRVVRPGGRLIVIEGSSTSGVFAMWRRPPASLDAKTVRAVLAVGGWKASRVVGEAGGAVYVEATKPRV